MAESRYAATDLAYFYERGVQHERERVAGALYELELLWNRSGEQVAIDRHAELVRLFRRRAVDVAERMGRTYRPYAGGPVDWESRVSP